MTTPAEAIFMANQAGPSTYDQLNGIYLEDYADAVLDQGMSWENVLEKYLHWTRTPRRPNVTVLGCSSGVEPPFEAYKLSPKEVAESPDLAKGITSATLPISDGESITIRLPQSGHLVDDRCYNGSGYLLAFYPIAGEIATGTEWSYSVQITHNRAEAAN